MPGAPASAGLTGHLPIVIAINGQHKINRADGSLVELGSFPTTPAAAASTGWIFDAIKLALTAGKAK